MSIEEKPSAPKSNFAVTGLYSTTREFATSRTALEPSPRGELEITDLNRTDLVRVANLVLR